MKKLSVIFISLGLAAPSFVSAQSDIDALRYTQSSLTGTARFSSMGGAFGALGADFSTLSYNPAGIGLYRKSEFTLTPSVYSEKTTSDFLSRTSSDNKFNFNFGNFGLVFSSRLSRNDSTPGWKSVNFGIGYNRLNNFHTRSSYEGYNPNNSYLDYILEQVNSGPGTATEDLDRFYQDLAYQTYLINPLDSVSPYHYSSVIPPGSGEMQRRTSETRGSNGEMVMSLGANYSNRFYIGGTLGIDFLRYVETTSYQEIDKNGSISDFNNYNLVQNLTTTGIGINFKLGMIFRATDWLRLGAAVHTPTFYTLHDDYSNTMTSVFDDGASYSSASPLGSYDYTLSTPFKAIGSAGFIIGKKGLVSVDYEYLDYSGMQLGADDPGGFYEVNNDIQQKYTTAGNLKIGTEWRIEDVYSVRAGYALFGSPFASGVAEPGADQTKSSYSIGFGIRDRSGYFMDFGYVYSINHDYFRQYSLYNPDNAANLVVPGAKNEVVTNNFLLTFGWRF